MKVEKVVRHLWAEAQAGAEWLQPAKPRPLPLEALQHLEVSALSRKEHPKAPSIFITKRQSHFSHNISCKRNKIDKYSKTAKQSYGRPFIKWCLEGPCTFA
jgi:hypothetical protein